VPLGQFKIRVILRGTNLSEELSARLLSFRRVWEEVIWRYISHNRSKFDRSRGQESSGASFDFGTMWRNLTERYMASKRRAGYEDWLMVRSGELMRSLTERDTFGWYETVTDKAATFGTILLKAFYHRETRPVMFLDQTDVQMVGEMFGSYLSGEPPFREFVPSAAERMDADLSQMLDPMGLG